MLPRVIVHNAISVDGRITGFTPDIGLYYELTSRWKEDATLAGSETMLAAPADEKVSEPEEKVESKAEPSPDTRPLLVVPDSRGRIRSWSYFRRQPYWRDVFVLGSRSTPPEYLSYLEKNKVQFLVSGEDHVDFRQALEELNLRFGLKTIRVDSGGTLNGVLLRNGLVNEISLLVHPCLVGSMSPLNFLHDPAASSGKLINLKLSHMERLREDIIWLVYEVSY